MRCLGEAITARPLSNSEVLGLLARHPIIAARVGWHNSNITKARCYAWGEEPWYELGYQWDRETFGIPQWGITVEDRLLGNVLIRPNADDCDLRYTATTGVEAETTNLPIPDPVPHDRNPLDDLADLAQWILPIAALGAFFAWKR